MEMSVESVVCSGEVMYFIPKELNILFSYSYTDEQIKIIDVVPEEDGYTERQFNGICKVDNKIVLVPYSAHKIWVYDLTTQTWNSVDVSKYVSEDNDSKFSGCIESCGKVYLFGYGYNGILSLNISTCELEVVFKKDGLRLWGQKTAEDGDRVYVALSYEKKYAVLNLETENVTFVDINVGDDGLASVGYDGVNKIVLPAKGNHYYIMNNESAIVECILPIELSKSIYNGLVVSPKYIYGYSSWGKGFLVNRENEDITIIGSSTFFVDYIKAVGFIESKRGELNFYDEEFVLKRKIPLIINDEELEKYYSSYAFSTKVVNENKSFDLAQYMKKLVQLE